MDEAAVHFLLQQGITHVISLNSEPLSPEELELLRKNGIHYTHVPVTDHTSPTLDQLKQIWTAYAAHRGEKTLVHCGYGEGRTGTAISAIQLNMGYDLKDGDYRANGVEYLTQIDTLDELKHELQLKGEL